MTSSPGGFIRGTPVWRDPSIVPIDQLISGDGQPRSVHVGKRELIAVKYGLEMMADRSYSTFAATDQAFDVQGRGWVHARRLREGDELLRRDGPPMYVHVATPVYTTDRDGVGWFPYTSGTLEGIGNVIDFNGPVWKLLESNAYRPLDDPENYSRMPVDVFQLYAGESDVCYVGSMGMRVPGSVSRASESDCR
jgi:hypothetical protein